MSIFGCMGTSEEIRGIEAVREVFRATLCLTMW